MNKKGLSKIYARCEERKKQIMNGTATPPNMVSEREHYTYTSSLELNKQHRDIQPIDWVSYADFPAIIFRLSVVIRVCLVVIQFTLRV